MKETHLTSERIKKFKFRSELGERPAQSTRSGEVRSTQPPYNQQSYRPSHDSHDINKELASRQHMAGTEVKFNHSIAGLLVVKGLRKAAR
ncbi:hypothetical protein RRG08_065733 [Elysia crispata]|uniref:Uncharacterized protein n=1 Tax=Elysia crispata TaxID=231223 RepID=A0AAE1DAQ2_9GAST|nr:hypothetical protein RRG08_065733 [Elysia crispata]